MVEQQNSDLRILILASSPADAAMTLTVLTDAELSGSVCLTIKELEAAFYQGAGAILIAEEMLFPYGLEPIKKMLQTQPRWSDIPVIVLMRGGDMTEAGFEIIKAIEELRNVTLLDRPVRLMTLLSVLRAAVKTRIRQYEMRNLLEEYKKSSETADTANRAKSSFLANMSHEIRTPLNAIVGFGDLLLDQDTTDADRVEFVSTIQRNGRLLMQIIDDILDLSKVEAGKLNIERVRTVVPQLVEEVMLLMRQQASEKGIEIKLRAEKNAPHAITTDPTRLKQILLNIIGNAVKFTSIGWVEISIGMHLDAGNGKSFLLFTVQDTGRGISETQKPQLFQPFMQADVSTTRKFGGTGLGLILSRRLSEALGGGLELTNSKLGAGSTFEIAIEACQAEGSFYHSADPTSDVPDVGFMGSPLEGVSILVVEDVPDNQHLICQILLRSGASVDLAENGQEGVEMGLSRDYDVVLMDLQMPIMDGLQATAELRKNGFSKPIVAVSAAAMTEERERAIMIGCDDHITKPISVRALLQAVCKFTGHVSNQAHLLPARAIVTVH